MAAFTAVTVFVEPGAVTVGAWTVLTAVICSETTARPADVMVTVAGEADPLLSHPAITIRPVTPIVAAADLAARIPPRMSRMFHRLRPQRRLTIIGNGGESRVNLLARRDHPAGWEAAWLRHG